MTSLPQSVGHHPLGIWFFKPHIPAIYVKTVLGVGRERGLDEYELIEKAGFDRTTLDDPAVRVPPVVQMNLINQILEQTGNNGLGFEIGFSLPLTSHGSLGMAIMCAGSMPEVFDLLGRFWTVQERAVNLSVNILPDHTCISLHTNLPLGAEIQRVYFECILTVLYRSVQMLIGTENSTGQFGLRGKAPDYISRFSDRLPTLLHDAAVWQYCIPAELADKKLPMSNPPMLALAVRQCERELALLSGDSSHFLAQVQQMLTLGESGYPSQSELAVKLGVSLRTMRRKLDFWQTSYRELRDMACLRDAICLLDTTDLPIQQIAYRLGYGSSGNFARVFRQQTGQTPKAYRLSAHQWARSNKPRNSDGFL